MVVLAEVSELEKHFRSSSGDPTVAVQVQEQMPLHPARLIQILQEPYPPCE